MSSPTIGYGELPPSWPLSTATGSFPSTHTNGICQDNPIIITSQADSDALSSCSFISDIVVQGNELTTLNFHGFSGIFGSLTVSSCKQLSKISAPELNRITNNFTLTALPKLTSLYFPLLGSKMMDSLSWTSLPSLTNVTFEAPGPYYSGDVSIIDTGLTDFSFLNFLEQGAQYTHVYKTTLQSLIITGNRLGTSFIFSGLGNCTQVLRISNNGPSADISLPDLTMARVLSFKQAWKIGLPALTTVSKSIELSDIQHGQFSAPNLTYISGQEIPKSSDGHHPRQGGLLIRNTRFQTFSAPNLVSLQGDFIVEDNVFLDFLDLPNLETLGPTWTEQFVVRNNSALREFTFPALWNSGGQDLGNVTISGNISKVSMHKLTQLRNEFHINSTSEKFDCSFFDKINPTKFDPYTFNGWRPTPKYSCESHPSGSNKDMASHWKDRETTEPSTNAILGLGIGLPTALIILAILKFYLPPWLKRRRQRKDARAMEVPVIEDGLPLEDMMVGDSVEQEPPAYTMVAKPEEVPPRYQEALEDGRVEASSSRA